MNACPTCHRTDRSSRVTAIVRGGTSRGSGSGTSWHGGSFITSGPDSAYIGGSTSHHEFSSHGQTDLARALTLDTGDRPSHAWFVVGGTALVLLLMIMFGLVDQVMWALLLGVALAVAVASGDARAGCGCLFLLLIVALIWELATGRDSRVVVDVLTYVAPVVALIGIGGGAIAWKRYNDEAPERARRLRVWSRLFHCSRDDLVFDPETGEYASVPQMDFLIDRLR